MDRKSRLSEVPESEVPRLIEGSPLIDPRKLRSCRSTPATRSLSRSIYTDPTRNTPRTNYSLKPIPEFGHQQPTSGTLHRSRSTSLSFPLLTQCPNHFRSPQYRVNPIVKYSERPFPERMNYGIAGYNTATSSRPRSFTESSARIVPEAAKRPRSFSSVQETKSRPRSITIPETGTTTLQTRASRSVLWRSWTRRFRDKMGRVRVRDACSKLLSRFRGRHL